MLGGAIGRGGDPRGRRSAHSGAWLALLAGLLIGGPAWAAPEEGLPTVHALSWERLGSFAGYTLNGHRIEAAHVSDPFRWPGQAVGRGELVELQVAGPGGRFAIHCGVSYGAVEDLSWVCDFIPEGGDAAAVFVLGPGLQGFLVTDGGATILEVAAELRNLEALELRFRRPEGPPLAEWAWRGIQLGYPMALRTSAPAEPAHGLATLAVLSSLLVSAPYVAEGPVAGARLDSFPVVERGRRSAPGLEDVLAALEARGATAAAALLRRHLAETRGIDRAGGAFVARNPWTPRVSIGLQGSVGFLPDPAGAPQGPGGGSVEVIGGLRLHRLVLSLVMGLHLGAVDPEAFAAEVGVRDVFSAAFTFGLQGRYVLPLLGSVEGILGAAVAGRARFVDVSGFGEADGAAQLGLALGPIVGLQYPLWTLNDHGSRLLVALEGLPEWSLWRAPSVTAPAGMESEGERLRLALAEDDRSVRVQLGLRLDL